MMSQAMRIPTKSISNNQRTKLPLTKILNKLQMLGSPRGSNTFPNLTGSPKLELVHLDRLNLDSVPANLCALAPRLHTL